MTVRSHAAASKGFGRTPELITGSEGERTPRLLAGQDMYVMTKRDAPVWAVKYKSSDKYSGIERAASQRASSCCPCS
jgi:hypothetical protein